MTTLARATGLQVNTPTLRKKKRNGVPAQDVKTKQDQAIDAAFGLLKGKNVLPLDALQFERDMREE